LKIYLLDLFVPYFWEKMGIGASVPSGISEELKDKTVTLLQSCKTDEGNTRAESLKQLWDIAFDDTHRVPLTHPALEFVPTMVWVLENCKKELQTIEKCTGALWCLSGDPACRVHLCQSEFRLIPAIMSIIRLNSTIQTNTTNVLLNCSIDFRTHDVLLRPDYGYLDFLMTEIRANPDTPLPYNAFQCLTTNIDANFVPLLVKSGLPQVIMSKWISSGTNTNEWKEIPKRCLNILLYLSKHAEGAESIRSLNGNEFIYSLLKAQDVQGIKTAFLAACVYGREESNATMKSLLDKSPRLLLLITSIFAATIAYDPTPPKVKELENKGFVPGVIQLSNIASALKNLSLPEKNKMILLHNKELLNYILISIQAFIDNKAQFGGVYDGIFRSAGGGGEDFLSLELFLELLLQLSFYYDDDETMRTSFNSIGQFTISSMLEAIVNLDPSRNVPMEAKQFAFQLLARLSSNDFSTDLVRSSSLLSAPDSSSLTPKPSHIMLSYAWGCNKNHVIALGKKLRELGYDVWRDEEGSSIVSGMASGENIVETLCEAIQYSHTVVICVSVQYKDSANCRAEAKYAHARSIQADNHQLKLIYVMMDEQYHTRSSPRQVDGWLGFMIGTQTWYPLWNSNQVETTAKSLAKLFADNGKIVDNRVWLKQPQEEKEQEIEIETETKEQEQEHTEDLEPRKSDEIRLPTVLNNQSDDNDNVFSVNDDIPSNSNRFISRATLTTIQRKETLFSPDFPTAFNCLEKKKAKHANALQSVLEDLGVGGADDLSVLEPEDCLLLYLTLRKPQQSIFTEALGLDFMSFLSSRSEPGPSADWTSAWECLEGKRAKYPSALRDGLMDFGVEKAEDLHSLDVNDLIYLAMTLKKPQQKAYYEALKIGI
jgi:hypothetical protein